MKHRKLCGLMSWCIPKAQLLAFTFLVLLGTSLHAQSVSGKVTSEDGETLAGATVQVQGTNIGVITGDNGSYTIDAGNPNATLVFSFVGFEDVVEPINGRSNIDVTMSIGGLEVEEQVITALGISRDKKALAYSVTEVDGGDFTEAREINVGNSLAGKVAGVNVSSPATGAAGSTRIIIRGNSFLSGDNQPLFVVDGIPIDNSNLGSAGMWGGSDGGDGISSLNPDDIDKVSVLKGSAASALYGSRGANGVILITTKTGATRKGVGVEFNSNLVFANVMDTYDWQNQYGSGRNGMAPTSQTEAKDAGLYSWGGQLDGSNVVQFDGVARPYSAIDDNLSRFYQNATTFTNSLAFTGGNEQFNFRVGATNLDNEGVLPGNTLDRRTLTTNTTGKFGKFTARVSGSYINEDVNGRPRLSDSPGNANYTVGSLPPNVDVESLLGDPDKPGAVTEALAMVDGLGDAGTELQFNDNVFVTNPYWAANQFQVDDVKNRILGSASLRYDITDYLYIQGRYGLDTYNRRRTSNTPYGTAYSPLGSVEESSRNLRERNADLFIGFNKTFDKIGVNAFVGGNQMRREYSEVRVNGSRMSVPFANSVNLAENVSAGYDYWQRGINSLFGSAEVSYDNWVYLTFTARNDYFTVLTLSDPDLESENSALYTSAGLGVILSDVVDLPDFWTFAKLRASYGQAANEGAIGPYAIEPAYALTGNGHDGNSIGRISTNTIPPVNASPPEVTEIEVGADLRFFNNRLGVDFTWYNKQTKGDLLSASISEASGYASSFTKVGQMTNTGIELLINVGAVRKRDFAWNFSLNLANNKNTVDSLAPGLSDIRVEEARTRNGYIHHFSGMPYSQVSGNMYERDDAGNIVYVDGRPVQGEFGALGTGVHPTTIGLNNNFRYKNFTLSFLIDLKMGAYIYNSTNAFGYLRGLHQNTLVGRADGNVADGVNVPLDEVDDFYGYMYNRITEEFVEEADFSKLRQLTFGYSIPSSVLQNTFISQATVSIVGRNLMTLYTTTTNIDPESTYTNGNGQGLEMFGVPATRTLGFNVNLKF